jgi:hypothetical protein
MSLVPHFQRVGKQKKQRRLDQATNDMEMVIKEAFANMNDGMKDMEDQDNMAKIEQRGD